MERTFAWLNQFRRLRVRYDKRADIHEAFLFTRVRADLLAGAAQDADNGLSRCPLAGRRFPRAGPGIAKHSGPIPRVLEAAYF
jgi:hypothetical protein